MALVVTRMTGVGGVCRGVPRVLQVIRVLNVGPVQYFSLVESRGHVVAAPVFSTP